MKVVCQLLDTKNWNDFEKLFSGCEQCRECWCLNHRVLPADILTGEAAKLKMKGLVEEGKIGGFLAYVDQKCIAWVSVDPIQTQIGHDYVIECGAIPSGAWAIHCMYISPEFRGKGISKEIIAKAIDHALLNNATSVLAFPIPAKSRDQFPIDEAEFSGRYSTYKKLGFKDKKELNSFYQVMELIF